MLISAMDDTRDPLPPRLMRPDLVEHRQEGLHLLGELGRLLDLTLVEMLVRVEAAFLKTLRHMLLDWTLILGRRHLDHPRPLHRVTFVCTIEVTIGGTP